MTEWLIIRFDHGTPGNVHWMTANEDGQVVMPAQPGKLSQLAPLAALRQLCVLVPASEVTTLDVELPARAGAKLLQAVPFAVEDQLADNVENMHFALADAADGARSSVAAVSRETFTGWMNQLSAAGLRPARVHVDAAMLPRNPGQIVALLERDTVLLSAPGLAPVALPSASLADALELTLGHLKTDATQAGLLLYASAQDWQQHSGSVDALRPRFAAVKVQLLPQGALPLFAQQLPHDSAINLLQGEFAASRGAADGFRPWRVAAALALLLLGLHAAGRYWELSRIRKTEAKVDASINELTLAALPSANGAKDLRRQVAARLEAIRSNGSGGSGDMLTALSAYVAARPAAPEAELLGFSFQGGALELRLKAPSADKIERLRQQLQGAGWQVVLKGGASHGNSFDGKLEVKPR